MELIRVVKEIKTAIEQKVAFVEEFEIIKDEVARLPKLRDNIQDYIAWVMLSNLKVDFAVGDTIELIFGVSGVSSSDDDDYLQVVSKCLYAVKKVLLTMSYINENDVNEAQITIDSEEREDSVVTYCYTTLTIEKKLSYVN